jgi:hypothetical protein
MFYIHGSKLLAVNITPLIARLAQKSNFVDGRKPVLIFKRK